MSESTQRQMEGAELELERRSKFLSSLILKKKAVEQQDHHDLLNVRVRASDMPGPLQNRAFRCARDHLDSMPGKLDSKRLALALKKVFDSSYGPAWHCIVGTSFGSYVTHSTGGFLYFSIDKRSLRVKKEMLEIFFLPTYNLHKFLGRQEHEAIDTSTEKVPILPSNVIGDTEAGPPHEALFLILTYLPLLELLSMNQVCTSLRDAVNKDVLSWLNIIVEKPLNLRLCDQILMKITSKANGRLRTLALMNCAKITDDALQRVIEQNPLINKLYLPACTGLTPEGVIRAVKTLSEHGRGVKSIMINGIYNIHKQHLETLESYLHEMNLDRQKEQPGSWPLLYHEYMDSPTFRHDKGHTTIDLEVCPKCDEVRMVFDCPRWSCKRKIERSLTECKGCKFCILRCRECGGCVDSQDIEEAVCADILCSNCWLKLPKCNFCNKPYCRQHTNNRGCASGSTGFICEVCYNKFILNLHSIVEVHF